VLTSLRRFDIVLTFPNRGLEHFSLCEEAYKHASAHTNTLPPPAQNTPIFEFLFRSEHHDEVCFAACLNVVYDVLTHTLKSCIERVIFSSHNRTMPYSGRRIEEDEAIIYLLTPFGGDVRGCSSSLPIRLFSPTASRLRRAYLSFPYDHLYQDEDGRFFYFQSK
jgi:hypothetical protein